MSAEIQIRPIAAADTYTLRHQVLWPQESLNYVRLLNDHEGQHFGAFEGAQLVSVISLFAEGETARFRKFATRPDKQRKGIGSKLLRHVFNVARQQGAKRIWCDARAENRAFYRAFGLEAESGITYRGTMPYLRMGCNL
ncbi:GNAT family N-acetyltransferase [Hymenobacter lutimineralis]|uniref:GNAT family N-acetyltransferase n=1 Tax=Hymenobacter lutimineralis TaxID=2606448 RepID=A0A5D6V422_9BACT|nr:MULTISPECIES: GNAT family N-acetyltransferase [Hymenobacter]QIX60983.1 GNAT family N-acetyltransferase [Hymenobacter sp. BT18]TYZ09619.1 GNAT family N-acetyltransferase [Hymenobacter lutimineralis]